MDPMASSREAEDPLFARLRDSLLWDEVDRRTSGGGAQATAERSTAETADQPAPEAGQMSHGLPDTLA